MTPDHEVGTGMMNAPLEPGDTRIGLSIRRRGNRVLLQELLADFDVVDIADSVHGDTDLCIVDDHGLSRHEDALIGWKRDQRPVYAPVLLLTETSHENPWSRYANQIGTVVDAIQPIPIPRGAIRNRLFSLLETRRYSQDLARERQLTDRMFDNSPVAKTLLDTDGTILRANERAEAVLGLERAEIIGREFDSPDWNIIDENGHPLPSDDLPFAHVLATGESVYGFEHGIERADGEQRWLSMNAAPLRNQQGEIEYIIAAIEDITEQDRLERELRASEQLHRTTLSQVRETVFITDDAGEFTYVCPNTGFIFGYTPSEIWDIGDVDGLLGDDVIGDRALVDTTEFENVERVVTDASGDEHTVLVTVKPVTIQDGTRLYTIRDITNYKEIKGDLEEHATHLEQAQEIATLGSWHLDVERNNLEWSDESYRIFEIPADQPMTYEDFLAHVHPEDREYVDSQWQAALSGEPYDIEHRLLLDSGIKWVRETATVEFEDGDPVRALGIIQDITAQKEREERLLELDETRSLALSAANAGIWEWNLQTGTVELHESSLRMFGIEPDDFGGTFDDYLEFVLQDDRTSVEQVYIQAATSTETGGVTFRIRRDDGVERWVHGRWAIQTADGDPLRLLGVNVDITQQQERITHMRVLDDVLRHNFHNQMNLVRGYAETIRDETSGEIAAYADEIIEWSDRLLTTTDKQREITKILSTEPRLELLDMVPLVEHITDSLQSTYPDVRVEAHLPASADAIATRDIGRALEELATNAILHNDESEKLVAFSVRTVGDVVEIQVSDNGPGIPEMEQNVVTGERNLEPLYHGSGLGLWLVSWIVRRAEGTLTFDTDGGEGTTVTIRVDAKPTEVRSG